MSVETADQKTAFFIPSVAVQTVMSVPVEARDEALDKLRTDLARKAGGPDTNVHEATFFLIPAVDYVDPHYVEAEKLKS